MPLGVYVTLATHNGELFLSEQIESVRRQSEAKWTLLILDDGSTDGTREIIEDFAAQDPRIQILNSSDSASNSALGTFSSLLTEAFGRGARYVFSCDQDDVWSPAKLARMLDCIRAEEDGGAVPVLLHHDLAVVDEQLRPIADSYWSMMQIDPGDERRSQRLLSRNEVTGCAMACNRALLDIALPIPAEAIMHDWWLALCAAQFGRLRCLPEPLVQYRQHAANVIGAKSFWSGLNHPSGWAATWRRGNRELIDTINQARVFDERFSQRLRPDAAAALSAYRNILQNGYWRRLDALRRARAWRHHWMLDATLMLRLMLLKSPD